MTEDIVSKKTRYEFREYFVGITIREIESEFDNADVLIDNDYEPNCSGQRRTLVEKYYANVDWKSWRDVRRIISVYESVLIDIESRLDASSKVQYSYLTDNKEYLQSVFNSLCKWLKKDGFEFENGKLEATSRIVHVDELESTVASLDIPNLKSQISRIKASIDDDPALAIGTAKELIETTCKTILSDYGVDTSDNMEISKLIKETRKNLGLVSESIPNSVKGVESIQRILSNLGAITQGLSELRNLYGSGHGKHGKSRGLSPRHARLAVGAASTLSIFLLETHEERNI